MCDALIPASGSSTGPPGAWKAKVPLNSTYPVTGVRLAFPHGRDSRDTGLNGPKIQNYPKSRGLILCANPDISLVWPNSNCHSPIPCPSLCPIRDPSLISTPLLEPSLDFKSTLVHQFHLAKSFLLLSSPVLSSLTTILCPHQEVLPALQVFY